MFFNPANLDRGLYFKELISGNPDPNWWYLMELRDCVFDMDADNLSTGDTSQRVKFSKSLEDSIPDIGNFWYDTAIFSPNRPK